MSLKASGLGDLLGQVLNYTHGMWDWIIVFGSGMVMGDCHRQQQGQGDVEGR